MIDYAAECADWLLPHQSSVEQGAVDAAVAARYWRALAAGNMSGRLPLARCVEAAQRARAGYRAFGHPRREFSSLIRLVGYLLSQGDDGAGRAAFEEARQLIQPDWPAEFHIYLLRREASLARSAGRFADALADPPRVGLGAKTGDWRLEVIARNNLVDLLWQVGPIEEAAGEAQRLAQDLRDRPSTATDTDVLYANLIGILSEMDRIDEASNAGCDALPVMRRSRNYFLEEWMYLFWRRGQTDVAATLLGAVETHTGATGLPPQPNEQRLVTRARTALEQDCLRTSSQLISPPVRRLARRKCTSFCPSRWLDLSCFRRSRAALDRTPTARNRSANRSPCLWTRTPVAVTLNAGDALAAIGWMREGWCSAG